MPYDKIDELYDALKKDGAVSKSRENFRSKMLAPGKEGYQNRLQLYNALKADGAVESPTYEEFSKRLGMHAVKPQTTTTAEPKATAPGASQAAPTQQKPATTQAQASTPAPTAAPAQRQKDQPLTPAQRQAMIDQVQQMRNGVQASLDRANNRMDFAKANMGLNVPRVTLGGSNNGVRLEQNSRVVAKKPKLNARTGKMEQTYITESGNEYNNRAAADLEQNAIDEEARQPLGLNMNEQQVSAAQKPADAVVAALWKEAEAQHAADREKNAEDVYGGNPWLHGGREMHIVDAATNAHKNEVSHLTRFDLQKMMDNAWGRVGKQMTEQCYQRLQKQYPTATARQLQMSAEQMARALSDNAVYKYAVAKNTPKSTLEFFAKTAADTNLLRTITKGLARSEAGTTGDLAAYEQAMSDYGKNHRVAQVGGMVTGMMFDPTTYISGFFGSLAGKATLNIGGRILLGNAAKGVGARLFGNTLTGRVVAGMTGGAGNLGAYEGIKEVENQYLHGGHINPQTGENEGYSAGDVLKSSLHGALLGSVTGTFAPLLGNVTDKMVKATSSTAGKVGIRAGELATSTVAEGTIFSVPEWISGDRDAMDVWTDNMAMMIGFKAQHMVKSAPRVIAGLRPIENPKTVQERNHNRMSFVERLRKQVDASPRVMAFTREEREELQKYGYGDLAVLFTRTPKQQKQKNKPTTTDGKTMNFDIPEANVEDMGKEWLKQHPEFDGYEAMERLMQDPNVSQSARAKAYYILTGRQLPMGTVTGYTTETDENGNIFVKSVTANGEVVTNRRFADEASAKREQDKIMRQVELNSVDVGERYTEAKADNKVWEAAIDAVAPGADPETVKRNYQAAKEGDKDAIANYGQMVEAIDKFMEENKGMADTERPEAIRSSIEEETGINVDKALKKEPSKRTEAEQAAVEDYLKRLFPDQNGEGERPMSDDEAGASAIYDQSRLLWDKVEQGDADAKAEVDAIAIRMKEAYQLCEDAFGSDAEMRMAEMEENPWTLFNNPELTEDQQDAVLYYINAKAAMDGVHDASNDAMENKRREVADNVERHTHKDYNLVQPATMKVDDRQVYIVKGNIVPLPDGTGIDVRNSDQSIVVCDAETGEYKFTSPDQIFTLGEAIDPQSELDEAYANIQAEYDAVLGGNGYSPTEDSNPMPEYGVNDTFTLRDADGNAVSGEVQGISEDGVEIRTDIPINGKYVQVIPAEEFEGMVESLHDADGNTVWDRNPVAESGESVPGTTENVQIEGMDGQQPMTKEQLQQYAQGAFNEAMQGNGGVVLPQEQAEQMQQYNQQMLDQEQQRKEEEANRQPTALERVPLDEKTGEPMFEKADKETALDALNEVTGGNEANTTAIVNAQVEQAQKALDALKKKQPTKKAPALKGSPMAMLKAQQEADANYNAAMEQYNGQVAQAEETLGAWSRIYALMNERKRAIREQQEAEQRERDQKLHDEAVAQVEEQKRIAAEKAAEQAEVGTHAVNPKIKEKWDGAAKVEGNANAITLADGSTIRGHYVLTEAGAASASHDVNNAFEPTEGFPIDENGESVNDRDYKRDTDAQRIVRDIAQNYDSRALQSPVIVSKDGIVLSGNNRTMSGDMAARQGTDKAYIDHLREFGQMYGFTPEQIDGMKHPRVVFVPDEAMPYDATTFARFNAEQQKKQGKDAQAVKLGKVVPDNVFNSIVGDISRYDRLSDFYADDKAVASAISQLLGAGVINEMQLPEMRTGNALSAAGRELIENTLIGKVFQTSPDAVRQIISTPTLRHAVIMGLNEIAHNRTLAKSGYDLSQELGAAVDLVARAKAEAPDIYKEGMPVSPYGRQAGLFDDEYGDSRVTDATVLLLADVLNSGKPSDLRKMLATYNNEAQAPASGQIDMFSGDVRSKEQLLNDVNEYFRNATPREQQAIVDAAVAERKQRAEANSEAGNVTGRSERSANRQGVGGLQEEARDEVANQAMSHDEAIAFIAAMENRAEVAPSVDLSIENWDALFGKDGIVNTPIGEVKMGDNQFTKMMREDRHGKLGMVKPTLENPDVILEDASKAKEDDTEERPSSYIFVKAFKKADGSRYYYFTSITVSKDGREVVVSNQEKRKNAIANLLSKDRLVWKHADDVSDASDVAQGLYSSQGNVSDLATEGTDAPQTSMSNNIWSASEVQNDNSAVVSDGLQSEPIADNDSTSNGTPSKKGKLQNRFDGGAQTERHPADVSVTTSPGIMQGNDIVWPEPTVGSNASTDTAEVVDSPTEVAKGETVDRGGNSSQPISSVDKVINNQSDLQENSEKSPANEGEMPLSEKIAEASAGVNTEPTEAQKEAGNYKKGHVQVGTFDITIEQPQGSVRKGTDANGKQWESKMHNTYGYFRGTEGVDGDHIDVFLSNDIDGWNGRKVYVVDQYNPDGTFDEHKVMLGFNDMGEAKSDYLANYENGWEDGRRITISATNLEDFEKWIDSSHRKTKPFAEYAGVKKETVANTPAKGETKGYSITPTTYTNKKGKTSDVSLLTFDHDLTADQERAVKEFAKERTGEGRFAPARGWKDRESGGWMFRSEEDARKAAEMVGNEDAVADNQPLTAQEMRDAVEPKKPAARKKAPAKKPANKVELPENSYIPAPDPDVQNHDWSQYKQGDIFDYEGYKSKFIHVDRDESGRVTGVIVQHLDENGNPIPYGREDVPPLMFMLHYKAEKPQYEVSEQKATGAVPVSHNERVLRDAVNERLREAGMDVIGDVDEGQRVLDMANGGDARLEAKHRSESAEKRNRVLSTVDEAVSMVTGKPVKEVRAERRAREAEYKEETKKMYDAVLSGDFNAITLQRINDYLDHVTPNNEYGRPLSKRLPPEVGRRVRKGERTSEVDVLFSRISESTVPANERTRSEAKRRIEEKKKELLKEWAIATGNWHTSVADFTHDTEPIGRGKDSVVYRSDDGKSVIKVSAGKDNLKKFRPDIDAVTLFNHIFPNSRYEILGYGEVDGKFVKFLKQPIVDFADSTPLSAEERVRYMEGMGFKPMNEECTAFSNGKFVVADLQGNNIIKDKSGNIRVIDADVKLHTKDFGGKYEYPPVEDDFPSKNRSGQIREQRVYHGSGADFDHFDHSYMGDGEGAQAYGWGTYVTEVKGIGEGYAISAKDASRYISYKGQPRRIMNYESKQFRESTPEDAAINLVAHKMTDYADYQGHYTPAEEAIQDTIDEVESLLTEDLTDSEKEYATQALNAVRSFNPNDFAPSDKKDNAHLYTVEIPDDNGTNYLNWDAKPTDAQIESITKALIESQRLNVDDVHALIEEGKSQWNALYRSLDKYLGSDKETSLFLADLGYTGIKYLADYMNGGRADGAKNYVIFNEADAKITDHVRFFRTANGEAYGFTVGGKIYIDPRIANTETPVHEYTHLWSTALRANNAKEWANVVNIMKGEKELWDEIRKRYPELKTDDEIADEVLAQYSGKRGAERLREEQRKIAHGEGSVFDKAKAISALERVKRALSAFWNGVCDMLHIHFTSAEEVADRVMKDLLDGVDPRKFGKGSAAKTFAEKHDIEVSDVEAYETAMKQGNAQSAHWAMGNIRRAMRIKSKGLKLSEFKDVFAPVRDELYARFGDLDELQKKYEEKVLAERNAMEAARKKAEEEAAERQKHLDELSLLSDKEIDKNYMDALDRGDEATSREMLDEAARRKGYADAESDYQGEGAWAAPSNPGYESDEARRADVEYSGADVNLEDMALGYSRQPADYFTHPERYSQDTPHGRESAKAIQNALEALKRGEKGVKVKVYRAVPTSVKEGKLRNGDWVTPSKKYAEMHGNNRLEGKYRIIEDEVPAEHLWWDANDANEFGYDDGKSYRYKNVKNNRKLNDLVTRDDKGNVIPPSKRFNSRKADIRYQFVGERGAEAADRAEEVTTRLDNLSIARSMEEAKKDAKTIKLATGWERGVDGKWRYEIPDIEYVPSGDANWKKVLARQPWAKELEELADRIFDEEKLSGKEMTRFDELCKENDELYKTYKESDVKYLDDYAPNDALYKAYPELKQTRVEFVNNPSLGWSGKYSRKDNTIFINGSSDFSYRSTLAHEIQHAIQDIEGFAEGGNTESVRSQIQRIIDDEQDASDYAKQQLKKYATLHMHAARLEAYKLFVKSDQQFFRDKAQDYYWDAMNELDNMDDSKLVNEYPDDKTAKEIAESGYHVDEAIKELKRLGDECKDEIPEGNMDALEEVNKLTSALKDKSDYELYNALAGEVEARNVQKRMDMTEDERRNSLAAETEDVAREDQIFLFGDGGTAHMGSRTDKRMAEIGEHFEGKELSDEQRAVVDVFSGKRDRKTVDITNNEGVSIHLEMQQGNEPNAGARHSIFRHVGKNNGSISYDEIELIPDIVKTGTRNDKGANVVYQKKIDGVRYTVYTDKKGNKEVFHDFYSNRKTAESESFSGKSTNTQSSARTSDNAVSAAKLSENRETAKDNSEKVEEDGLKFRLLEDDDPKAMELESLPESELVAVYRNVQAFEDDALGSPMAFTDAETGERRTLQGGKWNASAQEDIELTPEQQRQLDELNKNGYIVVDGKKTNELKINNSLFFKKGKTGDAQLQYWLKKNPEDSGVPAAYDPYDHAIETPLNTQFGTAYKRPNLVVVRSLIPKSEIDEPYHAKYALLPTGAHDWNNGRTLYLSRWSKIDKVLTREEEAKLIDEYWKNNPGKREALKSHRDYNRFVPQVRRELEKMGYRFELDGRELTPEESLALDEQNWENRDAIPGREGHIPFISNDDIARINAKMSGKWVGEPKEAMENAMTARVNELSESLNTPVRIVRTDAKVAALPSARQRRMKGSFNPLTGEVTIVVPNNANLADVENTFVHEVVGHDGLRVLFPEKEKLDNALDELYRVSNTGIQQTIDRMAQKMYDAEVDRLREKKRKDHETKGEDSNASYYADMAEAHAEASKKREQFKREATEEYGADLAGRIGESGFEKMSAEEQTFWGKLKAMLQKALQKLLEGLKIPGKKKWSDKEWAFVLHEAYKRKKNGGRPTVFDAADTEVMRRKTGFGETKFSDGHKKSAQPNEAALKHLEPIDVEHAAKVLQRREKAKEGLANVAKAYKNTTNSKGFISDLSNSLGLMRGSTGSGYGSFETPNGKVFTIRVSNHNINAANVGNEPVESIVIKTKRSPNRFHAEDGKYANEYVYFKEDIRQAPAGTLSSIAESISELLDTGEYHDKTGLAKDKHSPETDPDNGIMFRDGDSEEYNKAMARDTYERRVASGMYQTQEALQDSMLGLKEAMDAILKAEGKGKTYIEEVAGYENAYLGENRLSSTNQTECAEFARRLFKPMLEEVAKLAKTADERAELTDYMMAKHGLERNEVMARRAAEKKANEEFGADIRKAERAVNQNPLDQDAIDRLDDLRQQRDDREQELYFENRDKDYSGLTALTGKDNVADAESEARQMVTDYENGHKTDDLWKTVNAVNGATLLKTYESGLINKATYDDIKGMYTHYIPLRGFDDKTSEEAYAYLADKHSAFNAPMKTAKGRKSKADDPFANMEAMAESAIMQGNRNTLVKQKFLNFALNHPSDLVSVSDLWLRYDDVKDEWIPVNSGDIAGTEKLKEDDSAAEVERKMRDFEDAMEQAAKSDPAHFKKQKDAPDIPYRVVESRDLRQHQVLVKRNGKDYLLTINGNPRAAQALNGQTNPDNDVSGAIGAIMHLGEKVNRQLSAFYTTRNPDFVVSNFMRDMMYANTMVWVKESPNYAVRFHKNVAKVNPIEMKILLAKLRNGTLDMNDETEKMFRQFMMNGGETGYANIRDIEQRKNDIRRELKKMNGKLPIRKAWSLLGERLDEYNRAVENSARFAAFMTSRQLGRSIDRSIWDAKEISVNFNKKGSGAKFMGANGQTKVGNVAAFTSGLGRSFYVFWNAAIQGTTNFGRQAKRHPKKAIAGAATMFLLGALMAYLGGEDGDDDGNKDAYYNLPEYVRRSNVVFRLPGMDKSWISLPLPVEYRSMYGMGELMVSAMSGKAHYTDGELAHAMASQVSQMFPIDFMEGSGGFKPFIPSAVKPVAEVITNESWTGMPIYKDTPFNKDDPEWTKAYKSANKYLVGLSKTLNEATGGDAYTSGKIDINPAQVEYLLNGVFGGVSSTVDKFTKMGETIIGEREYDPRSFLLLNRVVKNGDERTEYRAVNNEYSKIKEESEALRKRLNHYENDTADGVFDYAEKIAWLNASPEYRILETYEEYSGDIDDINEELKDPTLRDNERKELEAELNQKKKELVDAVNAIRNGKQQ